MQGLPSPIQQEAYRTRFITHCATLLFLGRDRLGATKLSTLEETEITGLMVDAMRQITETDGAEQWMRYHVVVDDPPQSTKGRLGSSRPRIDIEMIEAGRPGARPRFLIEAKRLYKSDSVAKYLGATGLGMFLAGDYGPEQTCAGMLGYVQTKDRDHWRKAVESGFNGKSRELSACKHTRQMTSANPVPDSHSRLSCHRRTKLPTLLIYHFFLDCC